jgi:hypothetical protein
VFGRCGVSAARCDLDHGNPWPHGPTSGANLTPKSRRHHRAKQAGWTIRHLPDGTILTTSPNGRTYRRPPQHDPPPTITRSVPASTGPPRRRFDPNLARFPDFSRPSVLEQAWAAHLARPPEPPPAPDPADDEPPF